VKDPTDRFATFCGRNEKVKAALCHILSVMESLIIHGRQPELGRAELESLYGAENIRPVGNAATIVDIEPARINFFRLGGMVKFCKVLTVLDTTDWNKIEQFIIQVSPGHAQNMEPGRLTIGLSTYGLNVNIRRLQASGLELKKAIRNTGRPVRLVPNKKPDLNAAQVLHNGLTQKLGWELVFVRDGDKTVIAQSIAVQDIEAYAARDQARPKRDARVGMLPPKLAQIIINLAVGRLDKAQRTRLDEMQGGTEQRTEPYMKYGEGAEEDSTQHFAKSTRGVSDSVRKQSGASRFVVCDCFCGTGVILQEAMLMGYKAIGSDIDPRMVEYSEKNLSWLNEQGRKVCPGAVSPSQDYSLRTADATSVKLDNPGCIASEIFLGKPLSTLPKPELLDRIARECDEILEKFLKNVAKQTVPGFRLCLAVPAWKIKNGFKHVPTLDKLSVLGYNRLSFKYIRGDELVYHRENQVVGRELIVIERK
jgi:tRNA G10  N-methylase Trm11